MVTKENLIEYGFKKEPQENRPELCEDIEIWAHPKAFVAFYDPEKHSDFPIINTEDIEVSDLISLVGSDWKPSLEQGLIGRFALSPFYPNPAYMKNTA